MKPTQIERRIFAKDIAQAVRSYQRRDNWHGPLEALLHWSVIAAAIVGSVFAWNRLSFPLAALLYAGAVVLIGGRQRGLSGLLHQASHHTLMANRTGNFVVAVLFGGYPVLQSFSGYVRSHVGMHHGRFGSPSDPDYAFFRSFGLYGNGERRQLLVRFLGGVFSPMNTLRYVVYLLRNRIWTKDEDQREQVLRLIFWIVVVVAVTYCDLWREFLLFWIVPLITTHVWIGTISELMEHYPLMESGKGDTTSMSRNRDFGPFWRLVIGEHRGEGYHLVHHLFPQIPIWHLHRAHRLLMNDSHYATQPFARSPLAAFRDMARMAQL